MARGLVCYSRAFVNCLVIPLRSTDSVEKLMLCLHITGGLYGNLLCTLPEVTSLPIPYAIMPSSMNQAGGSEDAVSDGRDSSAVQHVLNCHA